MKDYNLLFKEIGFETEESRLEFENKYRFDFSYDYSKKQETIESNNTNSEDICRIGME